LPKANAADTLDPPENINAILILTDAARDTTDGRELLEAESIADPDTLVIHGDCMEHQYHLMNSGLFLNLFILNHILLNYGVVGESR